MTDFQQPGTVNVDREIREIIYIDDEPLRDTAPQAAPPVQWIRPNQLIRFNVADTISVKTFLILANAYAELLPEAPNNVRRRAVFVENLAGGTPYVSTEPHFTLSTLSAGTFSPVSFRAAPGGTFFEYTGSAPIYASARGGGNCSISVYVEEYLR